MTGAPKGYVDVAHRIAAFKEAFPDGSLVRGEWHVEEVGDRLFIVYTAKAYRTPTDMRPGVGTAWEPFPGPTPFTRDSELMNAETAAWGRAIAALGFEVREGIATASDVEARSGEPVKRLDPKTQQRGRFNAPNDKQLDYLTGLAKDLGADGSTQELLRAYAKEKLSGGRGGAASKTIERLKPKDEAAAGFLLEFVAAAEKWAGSQTDLPADSEGLDTGPVGPGSVPEGEKEEVPF